LIYDWYRYEDGPYLQDGLDRGFLGATNRERKKFALMLANHDWMHIHPANFLNKSEILAHGSVPADALNRIVDHVSKHYFPQPNYLLLDGKLDFSIYEIGRFIGGTGGARRSQSRC